ncbi:MAG: hypothetical protein IK037_02935, partial [Clostridia bacterium]|nr:hypothetical protein [Clostridia bacterium]
MTASYDGIIDGDGATYAFYYYNNTEFKNTATSVGNYTAKIWYRTNCNNIFNTNYQTTGSEPFDWSITPAPLTLSWSNDPVYNGSAQSVTATITGGVIGSEVVNIASYSGNSATNAGEYTATVTLGGADAANYTAASHDWEIVKGNIHISLNDKNITYGDAAPEYTATITGIASGEDESVLSSYTITCSYNTAQVANRGAGTYGISIPQTVTAENYDVFVTAGTLTVSKKNISVTPNNIWITYGDAAPTTFSASITGFVYGEDESLLQGTLTYNLSGYDQSDKTKRTPTGYLSNFVDPQPVYPITCSGLTCTSSNYTVGHLTGYLGVRKKQLNFNWASPLTFIYDGTEKTVLAEPILAYADDDVYVSTYEGNTATHYTNQGDGKYTATITAVDGDDKGNYFFDHNSQNTSTKWMIEGRTLQVAVTIGDTTVTYSDWDWGNYSTEVIFPASFAYDALRHEPTLAYVNLVEQDISGASFEVWGDIVGGAYRPRGSGSCIDAGNYWITYNLNVDNGDYLSTQARKVCYKIDPAPLTLAWSGDSGATYDGTQKSVSATITGGVYSGDVVNIIGYTNNQKTAVGNYGAEVLLYNSNNTAASPYGCNYYADPYLWSITPKGLTVTAEDKETTYGSGAPTFTVSYSGFATGDDESIFAGQTPSFACSYNTAQAANRGARTYAITPSGLTADNYDITFAPGTLTVGKKTVTVTANPKTITYGDAPANAGVGYSGFEYGETSAVLTGTDTITYSYVYQQYAPAGDYDITPSGTVTADNYAVSYVAGTLTVERRTLTFNWTIGNTTMTNAEWLAYVQNSSETYPLFPEAFVYNTAEQLPTVTFTNLVNGDQIALGVVKKYKLLGDSAIAVLTCDGANNYMYGLDTIYPEINYALPSDDSENIYFTIAKAPLTLTGESVTITYGDAAPQTFDSQWAGFVGTENTDVLTGLNTVTCTCVYEQYGDAGAYDVTPSGTVTADNYAIEYVAGTLTVEQFEVSITWSGMDGFTTVYNGAEQTVVTGATVSNKLNNDDVTLTVTGGKGTNVSNETHLATAALAGAKAGNYKLPAAHTRSFTITPKPVSVSAIADDMTYSGEEKGVTASYTNALGQDVNVASAQITYTSGVSRVNYTGNAFYAYVEVIDDNYTLVGGGNTLENGKAKFGPYTITKRGVKATINSGLNAETLVYTGYAKQVPTGSVKFGPVSGEARNLVITGINGNNTEVTAAGFTVSFRLSDDDQVNYVLIEEASGSNAYTVTDGVGTTVNPWIITPASLTVTAVNQSGTMTYSGVAQTPYVHTQVSSVHWQTITYLYSKTNGSGYVALDQITYKDVADVGTLYYKITAPNHNDVTGSIQITMSPKELTPAITGLEPMYTYGDAFAVTFSGVEDGLVGEDTLVSQGITQTYEYSSYVNKAWSDWASLTISGMTEIRNAGQHKIRYNFTCTSGNYVSHGATVDETLIVHRALTITPVDGQSKTYGEDDDPIFAYTVSGSQYDDNVVPGDTFFTGKLGRAYGFDAGTYAFELGTLVVKAPYSANYYMGEITGGKVFTINKATLTVTADNKTVAYGDAAPTYTATITGFVGGETEAALRQNNKLSGGASVTCAYQAGNNVGTYTITAAENDLEATNYDFVYETGTLTVNPANLTVTSVLQDGVLTYSTAAQTPEVIATVTAVNSQTVTYLYSKTEGSGYVALDQISYTDVADAGTLYYKFTAPNHNDAT